MSGTDFLVIGSGPAGVSAALPLAEAGHDVVMIDAAGDGVMPPGPEARRIAQGNSDASPKLATPYARAVTASFRKDNAIATENFFLAGALARGGLSAIWGGFAVQYDDGDMQGWPISATGLEPYYRQIIQRIGVSGSSGDTLAEFYGRAGELEDPPSLGPLAAQLRANYRRGNGDFLLGLARNALITKERDGRKACNQQLDCLWGCDRGAIYDARFDLAQLKRHANFRLQDNAQALALRQEGGAWRVLLRDGSTLSARKIILAAGCLGSTALAATALMQAPQTFRLLTNPVMALPFLVPSRLGKSLPKSGISIAQLGYRQACGADYVTGAIYEIAGLPSWNFTGRLLFSRRGAEKLFPMLAPALLVATCYFPGAFSDNRLTVTPSGDGAQLFIHGGQAPSLPGLSKAVKADLARNFRKAGAWLLPGAALAVPGTDVHYAGTLPMGGRDAAGTSVLGELNGAPGIHVVDGAVLPSLSAKYPTLTIMANAARIGSELARLT